MYPIIEEQAKINAFRLVAIPCAAKLYKMFGYQMSQFTADDSEVIDVTVGMNKLNDLRNASALEDYNRYKDQLPAPQEGE